MVPWEFFIILWGVGCLVFESCFLKIGIAVMEQCLYRTVTATSNRVGGGRVGSTPRQKHPLREPIQPQNDPHS